MITLFEAVLQYAVCCRSAVSTLDGVEPAIHILAYISNVPLACPQVLLAKQDNAIGSVTSCV